MPFDKFVKYDYLSVNYRITAILMKLLRRYEEKTQ